MIALILFAQSAGYRIEDFRLDDRTLTVAVWYPAAAGETNYSYGSGRVRGSVAENTEPAAGPFPFVVYSHGYGGGGIGSAFLCEQLAREGFLVAAPDHADDHQAVRIRGGENVDMAEYLRDAEALSQTGEDFDREAYAYRSLDVRAVIDGMLGSHLWGGRIDRGRIGVMGHSLGGYTCLAVAGGVEGERDERVKVALLFSPGVFMFTADDLAPVAMPVMLQYGEGEGRRRPEKREDSHRAYGALRPPKYLIELAGASHFAWGNGMGRMRVPEEQHELITRYSLAFLRRHLLGDESAATVLAETPAGFSLYRFEGE